MIFLLAAALLAGCGMEQDRAGEGYVATVNGEGIANEYLAETLAEYKEMVMMEYGIDVDQDEELLANLEQQALRNLINITLMLQECESRGITIPQEQLDESIDEIKSQFQDEAQFEAALAADGMDLDKLEKMIREDMLIDGLLSEVIPRSSLETDEVTDQDVEEYYQQQKEMVEDQGMIVPDFEEVKDQILHTIQHQREEEAFQKALDDYVTGLRDNSDIEILI